MASHETEFEKSLEQYLDWLATDVLPNEEAWAAFVGMLAKRRAILKGKGSADG